jgi:hypothetical protein
MTTAPRYRHRSSPARSVSRLPSAASRFSFSSSRLNTAIGAGIGHLQRIRLTQRASPTTATHPPRPIRVGTSVGCARGRAVDRLRHHAGPAPPTPRDHRREQLRRGDTIARHRGTPRRHNTASGRDSSMNFRDPAGLALYEGPRAGHPYPAMRRSSYHARLGIRRGPPTTTRQLGRQNGRVTHADPRRGECSSASVCGCRAVEGVATR